MPISSGASGRVDVGVDTSKQWAPDGVNARTVIIQHDSYLLRYQAFQELQKKKKNLETVQRGSDPTDFKKDGVEEEGTQKNSSEDNASRKASGGKPSKTLKLCVIL